MSAAAKTKNYDVVPTDVRRMTKLHTPAGDIKFTSLMKLIYAYIWTFQENKERGNDDPIHTNTNVIAWEMGVSEKAVIPALKALDAAGVVIKHTVKVRGNVNSSNYVAIPPASVVALGITPPKPGNGNVSNPASKKTEEKQGQPTSATIQDLIDDLLNSYECESRSSSTFEAVKAVVEEELKRSSYYDDPMKYTKRKETLAALGRFNIQVQHVMARLAEMALEQRGLDVPVKTAIAEYLQEYQEEQKQNEATATEVQPEAVTTPSTDAPTGEPADTPAYESANLASEPSPDASGQRDSVASNDDGNSDDGTDGDHAVSQDAGRVMAPLDYLRHWSYVGDDGLCDYGVMWGVSGADLDNLIGEHLEIREAEAEKNFKSQRIA